MIKILLTGGTIDKHYDSGELGFGKTHIPEILELGRNKTEIEIEELMLIDSLDMVDADRDEIKLACDRTLQDKILITHGTDTMVETAAVLGSSNLNKTIVIIGAMVPYEFKHTDAMFNIGFSLAAVQTLDHGVYIAMNGKIFDYQNVKKNKQKGLFEVL